MRVTNIGNYHCAAERPISTAIECEASRSDHQNRASPTEAATRNHVSSDQQNAGAAREPANVRGGACNCDHLWDGVPVGVRLPKICDGRRIRRNHIGRPKYRLHNGVQSPNRIVGGRYVDHVLDVVSSGAPSTGEV